MVLTGPAPGSRLAAVPTVSSGVLSRAAHQPWKRVPRAAGAGAAVGGAGAGAGAGAVEPRALRYNAVCSVWMDMAAA